MFALHQTVALTQDIPDVGFRTGDRLESASNVQPPSDEIAVIPVGALVP